MKEITILTEIWEMIPASDIDTRITEMAEKSTGTTKVRR